MNTKTNFIIMDDEDERDLIIDSIRETGIECETIIARSIEYAKDRLLNEADFNPDYIFIEWNADLLCFIRSVPRLSNTEVIVYVTSVDAVEFKKAELLGATHVLLKTTHETTLSKVLSSLYQSSDNDFVLTYPAGEENSYVR